MTSKSQKEVLEAAGADQQFVAGLAVRPFSASRLTGRQFAAPCLAQTFKVDDRRAGDPGVGEVGCRPSPTCTRHF
ncbi:hypothetical protein [Streptomyces sp. RPT161]|uniref:hypothetical protein n=1 Tax=Streptomyces sp. RPT161 TaxID=3015993 RepID=UPI0022B87421|nr:hypothetical protein [Streptomyces sp. RPT161]